MQGRIDTIEANAVGANIEQRESCLSAVNGAAQDTRPIDPQDKSDSET